MWVIQTLLGNTYFFERRRRWYFWNKYAIRLTLFIVFLLTSITFLVISSTIIFGSFLLASSPIQNCDFTAPSLPGTHEMCGMLWVPSGSFVMGANNKYADEGPERKVTLDGFWIDKTEVKNSQFEKFVKETGYVTVAERKPPVKPNMPEKMTKPGSAVFIPPAQIKGPNPLQWWHYVPGASWRHPTGAGSTIKGKENHPVVHIAFEDAVAYAKWAGRSLPTEAQWEYAARAGSQTTYPWGSTLVPEGKYMANTYTGLFPILNSGEDGYKGTSPAGHYQPNKFGLYDMIGNVWEWTGDWYYKNHQASKQLNPKIQKPSKDLPSYMREFPVKVIKGGSYLCAPNFCMRYRPAARHAQDTGLGSSHIGFRTVKNVMK